MGEKEDSAFKEIAHLYSREGEEYLRSKFQEVGYSSSLDELRKIYGDQLPRILLERSQRFTEDNPTQGGWTHRADIRPRVADWLPPIATSPEELERLKKPIAYGVLREGLGFPGARAQTSWGAGKEVSTKGNLGWTDPAIVYEAEHYTPSSIGHEQQHALVGSPEDTQDYTINDNVYRNFDRRELDTKVDESEKKRFDPFNRYPNEKYQDVYNQGARVPDNLSEAMGMLVGAVRAFGMLHGRPPDTEEEVIEAIDIDENNNVEDGLAGPFEKGKYDALRKIPWVKSVGKYITKNEIPIEGGMKYV